MKRVNNLVLISILSILIALSSLIASTCFIRCSIFEKESESKYDPITEKNILLFQNPELLELHNINKQDLEKINATELETVYVMQSIYFMENRYQNKNIDHKTFDPYIQNFLHNPKVKAIWTNIIYGKLMFSSPICDAINNFYVNKK